VFAVFRKHHDDKAARPHVFDMPRQVLVFLGWSRQTNQRSLERSEEPVLSAGGVQAFEIFFAMQDVDGVPRKSGLRQGLERGARILRIGNGAHDAIGRIRNETSVPIIIFAAHGSPFISEML
jgi:hypothetical protein